MSSEDDCLSPLMNLRPMKSSAILKTPLSISIGKSKTPNSTPTSTVNMENIEILKTPVMATGSKVTAAYLFSSCKKKTTYGQSPKQTVLVGDSSDEEQYFHNSLDDLNTENSLSEIVEDSITEYSLIRKWLINADSSFDSSDSETNEHSPKTPQMLIKASTTTENLMISQNVGNILTNQNQDGTVLIISDDEEETGHIPANSPADLQSLTAYTAFNKELCDDVVAIDEESPYKNAKISTRNNFEKECSARSSHSEGEYSYPTPLCQPTTNNLKKIKNLIIKPEQTCNHFVKLPIKNSPLQHFTSPDSYSLDPLESKLSNKNFGSRTKVLNYIDSSPTLTNSPNITKSPALTAQSSEEDDLTSLNTNFLRKRNPGPKELQSSDEEFVFSPEHTPVKGILAQTNTNFVKHQILSKFNREIESELEDVFITLTITDNPIVKPKKISKPRRKKKIVPHEANCQSESPTFLSSLSINCSDQTYRTHPEALPYLKSFRKTKDELTKRLFHLFNEDIFDNQLHQDFSITWNNRLTRTAGYCRHFTRRENGDVFFESRIELSVKVVDTPGRLRDTLVHELCHAATWTIDNCRGGHGPVWRKWANRALKAFPELPPITRCHNYEITYKFYYNCVVCSFSTGRHSKSVDTSTHVCPMCRGRLELSKEPKKNASSAPDPAMNNPSAGAKTPRTPNAFALFVKQNYAITKSSRSDLTHAAIMKLLSAKFAESKKLSN